MSFDIPEENQDETAEPTGLPKINYPLAEAGVQPFPYLRLSMNGTRSTDKPIGPNQIAPTAIGQPDTTAKVPFAQRLAALGKNPFGGPSSNQSQNAEGAPKIGIGHRILRIADQQTEPLRLVQPSSLPTVSPAGRSTPLPYVNPSQTIRPEPLNAKASISGFNNGQRDGGFFSEFVPQGGNFNANGSSTDLQRGLADFSTRLPTFGGSGRASNSASPQLFSDFLPRSYSRADRNTNVSSASSIGEQPDKTIETVPSGMKFAGLATKPAPTTTPLGNAQQSYKKDLRPKPLLRGSVGRNANNDVGDVSQVQQLLNFAIDNGELSGPKIPEDGKVTDRMLEMINRYQEKRKLAKQQVINKDSLTIRALAQNPLWDKRWSKYDDTIKKEVDYYNNLFKKMDPGKFDPLDWRWVKAMLWTEVEGPDVRNPDDWYIWPMQIGKNKADPGMRVIKYGLENTDRYVPEELRDKLKHQKMTGELNVRAGIAFFYSRAIEWKGDSVAADQTKHTYRIQKRDTLLGLAKRLGTTVAELVQQNKLDAKKPLRIGDPLTYRTAYEIPRWREWPTASVLYNIGNPNYKEEVEGKFLKIQKRW